MPRAKTFIVAISGFHVSPRVPPAGVPRYVAEDSTRDGWARSPGDYRDQLRTLRWHPGSATAIALRTAALLSRPLRPRVVELTLGELSPVHRITPGDPQLDARMRTLASIREQVLQSGSFDLNHQRTHLRSKNALLVVQASPGDHFVLDGNLRLEALRGTFPPSLPLEVKVISSANTMVARLLRRLLRIRGLERKQG